MENIVFLIENMVLEIITAILLGGFFIWLYLYLEKIQKRVKKLEEHIGLSKKDEKIVKE